MSEIKPVLEPAAQEFADATAKRRSCSICRSQKAASPSTRYRTATSRHQPLT
jgi:hypothetical protein